MFAAYGEGSLVTDRNRHRGPGAGTYSVCSFVLDRTAMAPPR